MLLKTLLPALFLLLPGLLLANGPVEDHSKADSDGPLVLYRGNYILVKALEYRDTILVPTTVKYQSRADVRLQCYVPKEEDRFSFRLHDTLAIEPEVYAAPDKILVLSDIEGDFEAFKMMLIGARVIDKKFRWTYGNGHLVLLGDFFDRGLQVTECFWLIYKLETEAAAAGGKVHFILGNHEVLNLQGDLQYMRQKYVENAKLMQEDYLHWYDNNSELGRWLRTKNAVERIGDYVFCHAGISPELATSGLSLHDVNQISRRYLGKPYQHLSNSNAQLVFDMQYGIFWYRGAAKNQLSESDISLVLQYAGAKRMVVGHTLQNDIISFYDGRVICVDLYHEENVRQGFVKTLLIEDGICFTVDSRGGDKSSLFAIMVSKKAE
ncbi:MAG: metallophosphoesterase [Saprospiraceae bacterium]|nr:metallophosphoesterase [Saprospiraceae bacterium]